MLAGVDVAPNTQVNDPDEGVLQESAAPSALAAALTAALFKVSWLEG